MTLRRIAKNHQNLLPKAKVQQTTKLKKPRKGMNQIRIMSTRLRQKVKIVLLRSVNLVKRLWNKGTIIKIRVRVLKQRNE